MNTAAYRTTELVGYLWPVPIYKQNINESLPRHLTTIKHCGRFVKGVVLGSEHGYIPGVIKVEKVGTCEVNGWKALDVDENVRKGGQQAVYDAHCPKHCAVSMASTFLANIVKICRLGVHVA